MWINRWLALGLVAASLAFFIDQGAHLLEDRRIRLRTLVTLDPPVAPAEVRVDGHTLSVAGALVKDVRPDRLILRAWTPTPTIRVLASAGPGGILVDVENVPVRVRVEAAGPVDEDRDGLRRTLRFSPQTTRRLAFAAPDRELAFMVLGDTGDSPEFAAALRLAAIKDADFLLHAGDLIYEDFQMPNIERVLEDSPVPVFMIRGNHDYRNESRINFMRRLAPPYYSFRMGGATFIILDNAGDYPSAFWRRSTQYRWWTNILGEPRSGPLFVAMHKPPFDRRTGPRYAPMLDKPFAKQLMADFVRVGVDAVFTGHVHESHLWIEHGIPYVISGEGYQSPEGVDQSRVAWIRVRGWDVTIDQIPIWRRAVR